jgi:hypothetical protein
LAYKALKNILELEFVKRASGISSGFRKIKKWTLWSGRPLRNEIENVHGVRTGYVGAQATPGVIALTAAGRETKEENYG